LIVVYDQDIFHDMVFSVRLNRFSKRPTVIRSFDPNVLPAKTVTAYDCMAFPKEMIRIRRRTAVCSKI
jgi:hypothetical protein